MIRITTSKMDVNKTKNITNVKQFDRLVELMEKNVEISKGFFTFGDSKQKYKESWDSFAIQLNSLGPPLRNGTGWQKVWNDLKNKIQKKLGYNKKEISATGGGSNKLYNFSQLEESIISLLSLDKTCPVSNNTFGLIRNSQMLSTSNNNSSSIRVKNSEEQSTADLISLEIAPVTTDDVCNENDISPTFFETTTTENNNKLIQTVPNQNRRKRSISSNFQEERRHLLQGQTKNIEEQTKYLKECARYSRKIFELKEKKMKMWTESQNEERKFRQQSLEFKLKNLKYKEQKLALKEQQTNRYY